MIMNMSWRDFNMDLTKTVDQLKVFPPEFVSVFVFEPDL